jgi:ABC-type polysaccharide/polyol phosphate transport system ATPase subunit
MAALLRARGLGKRYRVVASNAMTNSGKMSLLASAREKTDLWAVRAVDFELHQGEILAVLGRNGAGKTTMLRMIAQTTSPSEGQLEVCGRVGAMLGAEAAFSGHLTGRENCYLTGAILGISRREVARSLDAIVDLAGLDQFLDVPVRYYSSGMYLRLAVALALQLRTEILAVDEALNGCDEMFRLRAFEALKAAASTGRAVMVVSHDLVAIRALGTRALLLEQGRLVLAGAVEDVIARMRRSDENALEWIASTDASKSGASITYVSISPQSATDGPNGIVTNIEICSSRRRNLCKLVVSIESDGGENLVETMLLVRHWQGARSLRCEFAGLKLRSDWYAVSVSLVDSEELNDEFGLRRILHFRVHDDAGAGYHLSGGPPLLHWDAQFSEQDARLAPRIPSPR